MLILPSEGCTIFQGSSLLIKTPLFIAVSLTAYNLLALPPSLPQYPWHLTSASWDHFPERLLRQCFWFCIWFLVDTKSRRIFSWDLNHSTCNTTFYIFFNLNFLLLNFCLLSDFNQKIKKNFVVIFKKFWLSFSLLKMYALVFHPVFPNSIRHYHLPRQSNPAWR